MLEKPHITMQEQEPIEQPKYWKVLNKEGKSVVLLTPEDYQKHKEYFLTREFTFIELDYENYLGLREGTIKDPDRRHD